MEGTYLASRRCAPTTCVWRDLARWRDLGKVVAAAAAAAAVLFLPLWNGMLGVLAGAAVFALTFAVLLRWRESPRSSSGFSRAQHYSRSLLARLQT